MWTAAQQQRSEAEASLITQARRPKTPNTNPRALFRIRSGAGIRARLEGNGDSLRKGLATVQQRQGCDGVPCLAVAPLLSRIDTLQTDARTVVGIPNGFSWSSGLERVQEPQFRARAASATLYADRVTQSDLEF